MLNAGLSALSQCNRQRGVDEAGGEQWSSKLGERARTPFLSSW